MKVEDITYSRKVYNLPYGNGVQEIDIRIKVSSNNEDDMTNEIDS